MEQYLVGLESVERVGEEVDHEVDDAGRRHEDAGVRAVVVRQLVHFARNLHRLRLTQRLHRPSRLVEQRLQVLEPEGDAPHDALRRVSYTMYLRLVSVCGQSGLYVWEPCHENAFWSIC